MGIIITTKDLRPVVHLETRRECLKGKLSEIETNSKNNNIRDLYKGIRDFKKGYQARINVIKNEKEELLADSNSILNRWKDYFSQLLNVHKDNDVGEIEIQTAERLIPDLTLLEVEIAIKKIEKFQVSRYRPNSGRINTGWWEFITHGNQQTSTRYLEKRNATRTVEGIHNCTYLQERRKY